MPFSDIGRDLQLLSESVTSFGSRMTVPVLFESSLVSPADSASRRKVLLLSTATRSNKPSTSRFQSASIGVNWIPLKTMAKVNVPKITPIGEP